MTAHWRSPIDLSDETLEAARAQTQTFRDAFVTGGSGEAEWEVWCACSRTTSTRRTRWQSCTVAVDGRARLGSARLDLFGLGGLAERAEPPAEVAALASARAEARAGGDYAEADRLRGQIEAAGWEVRDVAGGFELVPR